MINLEGLDPLAEIGGMSAYVDRIANAQRTGLEPDIIPAHFDTYPLVDVEAAKRMLASQVAAKK
jgi:hypothetical protein